MASLQDDQYLNPVYKRNFPDPFVLKFRGQYFAYCTGHAPDGNVFQVLRSDDLADWQELAGAMLPLDTDDPFYWAPEVTYYNGKFYLYYSVGNETLMHLRVAVSKMPEGPFVDSGARLTSEEFAIDAHVFRDDDGRWFMFYATDFLTHTHVGTGTVIDRMIDPYKLAGEPRPVTRAKHDWQVYDPNRLEKGGVRWHTVEGPTVLKRKGRYFEMFSGGNWQNVSYGVSYAVTDDIDAVGEWEQHSDGIDTLPILRTLPGQVIGPGHNSVVRGPNNRELFCVYHRWVDDKRVLSIDRMDFGGGDSLLVYGPTHTPQLRPFMPHVADGFSEISSDGWQVTSGDWHVENNEFVSASNIGNEISCAPGSKSFLAEVYLRSTVSEHFGIALHSNGPDAFRFTIDTEQGQILASWHQGSEQRLVALPTDFDPQALHLLRIEADHQWVRLWLDDVDVMLSAKLGFSPAHLALTASGVDSRFSAFSLTHGFEERFEDSNIESRGWSLVDGTGDIAFQDLNLVFDCTNGRSASLVKQAAPGDFELVVNICPIEMGENATISFGRGHPCTLKSVAPITMWDPLESTCRHASLSIL